jgi:hypothetical protein
MAFLAVIVCLLVSVYVKTRQGVSKSERTLIDCSFRNEWILYIETVG